MNNKHIETVCNIGQGHDCCKYLTMSSKGFQCAKYNAESKQVIDNVWAKHAHVAQGDNCDGVADLENTE